ncbi:Uncharacterised protein [Bordetella pertussis]|nr:Uncharacterised protein [Bordetella pertussis]CFW30627.1 Uncharacterised protein [Bordetella pertussis]
MDELDDRGQQLVVRALVAERARHHQHHGGPHALAAGADDVVADGADQHDIGIQPVADDRVDSLHVVGNRGNQLREIQGVSDR